jgi:hypothetical protein
VLVGRARRSDQRMNGRGKGGGWHKTATANQSVGAVCVRVAATHRIGSWSRAVMENGVQGADPDRGCSVHALGRLVTSVSDTPCFELLTGGHAAVSITRHRVLQGF